jgi:hypothetical protein
MRSTKVALSLAVLGTALISTAAFAQQAGRAANDGGPVQAQSQQPAPTSGQRTGSASNTSSRTLYNSAPQQQSTYPVGRAANDGGTIGPQGQGQ